MKLFITRLVLLFSLLTLACANAEIYSWVDKDGKKHFGQEVPKEYAKQSTVVETKPINSMDATKVPAKPKETNKTAFQLEQERRFVPPEIDTTPARKLSSCEQQKQAYEQAEKCFSNCRQTSWSANGQIKNDVSSCHCADAKRPDC